MTTTAVERFTLPDVAVSPILDGWAAGHYTLPPAIPEGARAVLAARATLDATPNATPFGKHGIAERDAATFAAEAHRDASRAARAAADGLAALVAMLGDEIIVAHLRPAHAEALATIREAAPALRGVDVTDFVSVARGGAPASAAFLVVVTGAERLRAISAARECVFHSRAVHGWRDPDHATRTGRGYLRDTSTWPPTIVATMSKAAGVPSGPGHPLARALWLSDPSNGAWCPTPEEWEAEFIRWMRSPARNGVPTPPVPSVGRSWGR